MGNARSPTEPLRYLSARARARLGTYHCARCGLGLFSTNAQFEFGTGCWPNFTGPLSATAVEIRDKSTGSQIRHEVRCRDCKGNVGHMFADGPGRTAERYCIEWALVRFAPDRTCDDRRPARYREDG